VSATEILEQIRQLSPQERREIAQKVLEEVRGLDDELTPDQIAELERRADEFRKNPEASVPWEQVRDEVRERFGWK